MNPRSRFIFHVQTSISSMPVENLPTDLGLCHSIRSNVEARLVPCPRFGQSVAFCEHVQIGMIVFN